MEHIEKLHLSGVFELGLLERRYLYEIYENTTTYLSRACSLGIWERTIDWVDAKQRKLGVSETFTALDENGKDYCDLSTSSLFFVKSSSMVLTLLPHGLAVALKSSMALRFLSIASWISLLLFYRTSILPIGSLSPTVKG